MKRLSGLSQNYLRNPRFVKELIGNTLISARDTVYDIGTGSGVVTMALAQKAAQVVAIEVDPRIIPTLRANMQPYSNVVIQQADVLTMPLPLTPYKVFANIPFSLSSPIVQRLTQAPNPPKVAYLIVQKEFANKLLPDSRGFTSQLGVLVGIGFAVRIRRHLKPSDFTPQPRIAPVLIELKRRPAPLIAPHLAPMFRQFVTHCFTNPHAFAGQPLAKVGVRQVARPSQLTIAEWVQLFEVVKNSKYGIVR